MRHEAEVLAVEYIDEALDIARRWALCHGNDVDEAKSIALVVLVELAESHDPQRGASFRTYLHTLLPRRIIDELRSTGRYGRRRRVTLESIEELQERFDGAGGRDTSRHMDEFVRAVSSGDFTADVDHDVWLGQAKAILDASMEKLPPTQQSALAALALGPGASLAMARAEGVSESAFSFRRKRALERLRRSLPASPFEDVA